MSPNAARKMDFDLGHDFAGEAAELAAADTRAAIEAIATDIRADMGRMDDVEIRAAESLDEDTYTELFVTLAEASDCGLIELIESGALFDTGNMRHFDALKRLARLADKMRDTRATFIEREAAAQWERQG